MSPPKGLSRRKPARRSAPAANSARTLPAGGGAMRQARTPVRSRTRPTPGLSQLAPGSSLTRRRTRPATQPRQARTPPGEGPAAREPLAAPPPAHYIPPPQREPPPPQNTPPPPPPAPP